MGWHDLRGSRVGCKQLQKRGTQTSVSLGRSKRCQSSVWVVGCSAGIRVCAEKRGGTQEAAPSLWRIRVRQSPWGWDGASRQKYEPSAKTSVVGQRQGQRDLECVKAPPLISLVSVWLSQEHALEYMG